MEYYFAPASEAHQKKEKAKARELKQSQWWRQEVGKGVCYHCEQKFKPSELTMDHVMPIVRGGFSNKKNCVPSCKDCNTKKGYKTNAEIVMESLKQNEPKENSED